MFYEPKKIKRVPKKKKYFQVLSSKTERTSLPNFPQLNQQITKII